MSGNVNLHDLMERINDTEIASIKGIINGLFKVLKDPHSSAKDLEEIIEADPSLAAKVIKLANSAYYAPNSEINNLKEAIIWVGFQEVRDIAITHKLYNFFDGDSKYEFSRSGLWKNSLSVAILSQLLFRQYFTKKGADIYTISLLKDLGIIIEDQFCPSTFKEILSLVDEESYSFLEAEKEILGLDHQEIFKEVADNWNLPDKITTAVFYHHNPEEAPEEFEKEIKTLYIANNYCATDIFGYSDVSKNDEKYQKYLDDLGIEEDSLELLESRLWDEMQPFLEQDLISHNYDDN